MSDVQSSIHGHEIMHLIHDTKPRHTRATLAAAVAERFGVDATFHTCSATSLTLDGLLSFLIERGKVVEQEGQLMMNIAKMCNHG